MDVVKRQWRAFDAWMSREPGALSVRQKFVLVAVECALILVGAGVAIIVLVLVAALSAPLLYLLWLIWHVFGLYVVEPINELLSRWFSYWLGGI